MFASSDEDIIKVEKVQSPKMKKTEALLESDEETVIQSKKERLFDSDSQSDEPREKAGFDNSDSEDDQKDDKLFEDSDDYLPPEEVEAQ